MFAFRNRVVMGVILAAVIAGIILLFGKGSADKVAVKINDYPLTAGEFNELFAEASFLEDSKSSREIFLDNLITRKLLLQEATKRGLDKEKDFLESIEKFWEQSLLKIIVDVRTKEIAESINVTDEEIESSFKKWVRENPDSTTMLDDVSDIISEQLKRQKQTISLKAWMRELRERADITIDKEAIGLE